MPKAYVLINCNSGYETLVIKSIKSIKNDDDDDDNVLAYNIVYGLYDIIVEINFDSLNQLQNIIQKKIRKISKIQSTVTLIPYEFLRKI
jgi:DNA-binding Lrp family transcriptional regulator